MAEAKNALLRDASEAPAQRRADSDVPETGGILTIDLGAVATNWLELGRRAMPSECAAVIKANGYGCGIEPVARVLAAAGCKTFFVADLSEARRVRAVLAEPAIYVLNGLLPGTAAAFADIQARPVIGSLVELAEWDAFCAANEWRGGAALHVDTGMNRLGISANEAAALAPRIRAEKHGITLLMSHLVCADQPAHPLNEQQIKLFREVRLLYRHLAHWQIPPGYFSAVRRTATWCGPEPHCLASTRRRDAAIPCALWSICRRVSSRFARCRKARLSVTTRPGLPSTQRG
jgi:alanine racemase